MPFPVGKLTVCFTKLRHYLKLQHKKLTAYKITPQQFRLLGILPLTFFSAQAIHYWQINEPGHMLWMCNIGNLLLALGLFFEQTILIRIAVIWMVPGLAVWFAYVVPTWGMLFKFSYTELFGVVSSTLAHLGGFCVAMVVGRQIRIDRWAWLQAFIWYFVVQLASRLLTPAALNVNLAHNIQSGWEHTFTSYLKFWLTLSALVGICLWLLSLLLRMLWPEPAPAENESA
jgi:hypothetical protein